METGNINQLLFRLEPYVKTLEKSHGIMGEFVNPKYADAAKTVFKKPTRLECMMQDYPKVCAWLSTPLSAYLCGYISWPCRFCINHDCLPH